jgi:hypothetical protein
MLMTRRSLEKGQEGWSIVLEGQKKGGGHIDVRF